MALSANTVWEVRTGGNDTNGGGFVEGASGTDWSQQDAPQYSVTDAVTNGTATITSATANFGTDVVGNILYIQGGTGSITAGWYEIISRTNATTIVVDRATGLTTGTGATLKIGGAFASIGRAAGVMVAKNWVFVKSGTYTIGGTANTPGGPVSDVAGGDATRPTAFIGYDTNRTMHNTDASRPLFTASGYVVALRSIGGYIKVCNLRFEKVGGSVEGIAVQLGDRTSAAIRCYAKRFSAGFQLVWNSGATVIGCFAESCTTGFYDGGRHVACIALDCSGVGFLTTYPEYFFSCVSAGNGSHGFHLQGGGHPVLAACTAANNGGDGLRISGSSDLLSVANLLCYGNGGYGVNRAGGAISVSMMLAAGANTSGRLNSVDSYRDVDGITLTADPFTDAANGDFSLNNAAGGGALLKGTGYPQTMPVV